MATTGDSDTGKLIGIAAVGLMAAAMLTKPGRAKAKRFAARGAGFMKRGWSKWRSRRRGRR